MSDLTVKRRPAHTAIETDARRDEKQKAKAPVTAAATEQAAAPVVTEETRAAARERFRWGETYAAANMLGLGAVCEAIEIFDVAGRLDDD